MPSNRRYSSIHLVCLGSVQKRLERSTQGRTSHINKSPEGASLKNCLRQFAARGDKGSGKRHRAQPRRGVSPDCRHRRWGRRSLVPHARRSAKHKGTRTNGNTHVRSTKCIHLFWRRGRQSGVQRHSEASQLSHRRGWFDEWGV